jgi:hypothetical protein
VLADAAGRHKQLCAARARDGERAGGRPGEGERRVTVVEAQHLRLTAAAVAELRHHHRAGGGVGQLRGAAVVFRVQRAERVRRRRAWLPARYFHGAATYPLRGSA